jgi:hypothetical protein
MHHVLAWYEISIIDCPRAAVYLQLSATLFVFSWPSRYVTFQVVPGIEEEGSIMYLRGFLGAAQK